MPIHSDRNLYPGVNAHLNNYLQQPGGGWESFHTRFINDLQAALDEHLPPNYYALSEKSLQITALPMTDEVRRTRPDIGIFHNPIESSSSPRPSQAAIPFATLPLVGVIDDEEEAVVAVVIYEVDAGELPGTPVTRIELLSPANKYPGSDYRYYLSRRKQTLRAGIHLVEVDFLNLQVSLLAEIPGYVEEEESPPYLIIISSPAQDAQTGKIELYGADIAEPLPRVVLPLKGEDTVLIDFGVVYETSFRHLHRLAQRVIDYSQKPLHFERYRPQDQEKISAMLDAIRKTHGETSGG
ncbi:MAG: DUF4058 family protein [Anaerolineae bacterium]|nr:DUF4058 family protein [Anaerolineae bacterium]